MGTEIETFLGPEMTTSEASAIWDQKSQKVTAYLLQQRHKLSEPF